MCTVGRTDFARLTNTDFQSIVTAYGGHDVTTTLSYRTLADIHELRWVCFVLSKSGTKRQCRQGDPPPNRLTARRHTLPVVVDTALDVSSDPLTVASSRSRRSCRRTGSPWPRA
jgi:hypothetical protein